jgi:hypothetical protein
MLVCSFAVFRVQELADLRQPHAIKERQCTFKAIYCQICGFGLLGERANFRARARRRYSTGVHFEAGGKTSSSFNLSSLGSSQKKKLGR